MYLLRPIVLYFYLTRVIVLELLESDLKDLNYYYTKPLVLTQLSQVGSPILINETGLLSILGL